MYVRILWHLLMCIQIRSSRKITHRKLHDVGHGRNQSKFRVCDLWDLHFWTRTWKMKPFFPICISSAPQKRPISFFWQRKHPGGLIPSSMTRCAVCTCGEKGFGYVTKAPAFDDTRLQNLPLLPLEAKLETCKAARRAEETKPPVVAHLVWPIYVQSSVRSLTRSLEKPIWFCRDSSPKKV